MAYNCACTWSFQTLPDITSLQRKDARRQHFMHTYDNSPCSHILAFLLPLLQDLLQNKLQAIVKSLHSLTKVSFWGLYHYGQELLIIHYLIDWVRPSEQTQLGFSQLSWLIWYFSTTPGTRHTHKAYSPHSSLIEIGSTPIKRQCVTSLQMQWGKDKCSTCFYCLVQSNHIPIQPFKLAWQWEVKSWCWFKSPIVQ